MLCISPFILLVVNSWIIIWLILEISSMSFVIFIVVRSSKNKNDWGIIYFLIQVLGSVFLLYSFMYNEITFFVIKYFNICLFLIIVSVLLKLGIFPFHFWLIKLTLLINFKEIYLLLIIQKLAPLWLVSSFYIKLLILVSLVGIAIRTIIQFSVMRIILLIVLSSITHIRWIIIGRVKNFINLLLYYFFYRLILFCLIEYLYKFISHSIFIIYGKILSIVIIGVIIYSLAGIPLLLGFLPKWVIFYSLLIIEEFYVIIFFIFFARINFYIYNRLLYNFFLILGEIKIFNKKFLEKKWSLVINFLFPFNLLIIY